MKKKEEIFDIEYTENDLEYIDELIYYLKTNYQRITDFYQIKNLSKRLNIKIWDTKDNYQQYFNQTNSTNKKIPDWEISRVSSKEENRIDLLTYKEIIKYPKHKNTKIEDLKKRCLYEFANICFMEYTNQKESLTWIKEAISTNLSEIYNNNIPLELTASKDTILNRKTNSRNYYILGQYLLQNYDKKYILSLIKNKEQLIKETPKIYEEAQKYIGQKRIEQYNQIKTPEELLEFMKKYIHYGIKTKEETIFGWDMNKFQKACQEKWKFQEGIEIIKSGFGHCWDQTEIERDWFKKNNYEYKTLFILFEKDHNPSYICHTYLIYKNKNNNIWNWFEHADENNEGIHSFNTKEEAILAQKEKHIEFNQKIGLPINKEIIDTIHIYEYQPPKIGSNNQEFLNNIFSENSKDITEFINTKRNKKSL